MPTWRPCSAEQRHGRAAAQLDVVGMGADGEDVELHDSRSARRVGAGDPDHLDDVRPRAGAATRTRRRRRDRSEPGSRRPRGSAPGACPSGSKRRSQRPRRRLPHVVTAAPPRPPPWRSAARAPGRSGRGSCATAARDSGRAATHLGVHAVDQLLQPPPDGLDEVLAQLVREQPRGGRSEKLGDVTPSSSRWSIWRVSRTIACGRSVVHGGAIPSTG